MTTQHIVFTDFSDDALVTEVVILATNERCATSQLLAALGELDARRLYLGAGCSSLFTYCTQVLHLSEHAAYGRIEAARLARRFPRLLELLAEGALTLTSVCLLSPILTDENFAHVIQSARHKSKRDVELLVASMRPQPPAIPLVRRVAAAPASVASPVRQSGPPVTCPGEDALPPVAAPSAPARPVVKPLSTAIYKVQFTLSAEGHDRLRRAQDLLKHVSSNGDLATVFERAPVLLVEDLERKKAATTTRPHATASPRPGSRCIPAAVRREVWRRDGGRCAFTGSEGRCTERGRLEFHHVVPYAAGGAATAKNIELRCAAHNRYEAELRFGAFELVREEAPAWGARPRRDFWARTNGSEPCSHGSAGCAPEAVRQILKEAHRRT